MLLHLMQLVLGRTVQFTANSARYDLAYETLQSDNTCKVEIPSTSTIASPAVGFINADGDKCYDAFPGGE
jgi:hypothetical protein